MSFLPPGASLGGYVVSRHVITSGMSEVYEARDARTGSRVAVKLMSPELCSQPELVARFQNEGRMLQHVPHEHIVRVFTLGELPRGPPYMVLEWVPWSLREELARAVALPASAAMRLGQQLASALTAMHERGFVHRDLKPSNVLLSPGADSGWRVKLADLGLAKALSSGAEPPVTLPISTGGSTCLGTCDYMAPEQWIASKTVGIPADVYALGLLLFQMLAGQLPFMATRQKDWMRLHLFERPQIERLEGRAPADLRTLISRMLAKEAAQRPSLHEISRFNLSDPA